MPFVGVGGMLGPCVLAAVALAPTPLYAPGGQVSSSAVVPAGWHVGVVADGRRYFVHADEPDTVHWTLPTPGLGPPAAHPPLPSPPGAAAETTASIGEAAATALTRSARRRLGVGDVVATHVRGQRRLVTVAAEHDLGGGEYSYTVSARQGPSEGQGPEGATMMHYRRGHDQIDTEMLRFRAPRDGQVYVSSSGEHVANITVEWASLYADMGHTGELCLRLEWTAMRWRGASGGASPANDSSGQPPPVPPVPPPTPPTPETAPDAYLGARWEELASACFDEPPDDEQLVLFDIPEGQLRLQGSWTAASSTGLGQHEPSGVGVAATAETTTSFTVMSEADTLMRPSYEWQRVQAPWQVVAVGMELQESGSGGAGAGGGGPTLARVPPRWTFVHAVEPGGGELSLAVGRATTVGEIRAAAQRLVQRGGGGRSAGRGGAGAGGGGRSREGGGQQERGVCGRGLSPHVELAVDGELLADDAATVEELQLFGIAPQRVRLRCGSRCVLFGGRFD
jgi:hypothetical protein